MCIKIGDHNFEKQFLDIFAFYMYQNIGLSRKFLLTTSLHTPIFVPPFARSRLFVCVCVFWGRQIHNFILTDIGAWRGDKYTNLYLTDIRGDKYIRINLTEMVFEIYTYSWWNKKYFKWLWFLFELFCELLKSEEFAGKKVSSWILFIKLFPISSL